MRVDKEIMLRINWDDPLMDIAAVDAGGGDIYHYNGQPFAGVLYENFPNGNLSYEIECKNGHPDGLQRHYYSNGQLNEEYYFKYNLSYGIRKEWDEQGNPSGLSVRSFSGHLNPH